MKVMLDEGAIMPTRAHDGDAGLDFYSPITMELIPGRNLVHTGIHMEIPYGSTGLVRGRSGLAKQGVYAVEGTVDYGYTGEILVMLYNDTDSKIVFARGSRIAQIVIVPCDLSSPELVDHFVETERGDNGFGSTGR